MVTCLKHDIITRGHEFKPYTACITSSDNMYYCGGTGTEVTLPTNTVQVPMTTGTVTDSGSECTGFIGDKWLYIQDR